MSFVRPYIPGPIYVEDTENINDSIYGDDDDGYKNHGYKNLHGDDSGMLNPKMVYHLRFLKNI